MTSGNPNTRISVEGTFKRASRKFWEMRDEKLRFSFESGQQPITKYRSGGRAPIVAVFDPSHQDYRLKVWMDFPTENPSLIFDFNGNLATLDRRSPDFYSSSIDKNVIWKLINNEPCEEDYDEEHEDTDPEEYRDYCVETRFDLDRYDRGCSGYPGDVSSFPKWMKATAIGIYDGGGQGPRITLVTALSSGSSEHTDLCHGLRINGFWCTGMPMSYQGNVAVLYTPTPDEAAEIKGYGDGEINIEMPNEARPPRTRHLVRKLYNFLKENASTKGMDAWNWRDDVMKMQYAVLGMGISWGQMSYWKDKKANVESRKSHWVGCLNRHFDKRSKAFADYTMDEWVDEVKGNPEKWRNYRDDLDSSIRKCDGYIGKFNHSYSEQLAIYDERLGRIEEREEKFADAIELMQVREKVKQYAVAVD